MALATLNISSIGTTHVIAGVAGKTIRVQAIYMNPVGANTAQFQDTASPTPNIFIPPETLSTSHDWVSPYVDKGLFDVIPGNGLDIVTTTASLITGYVLYDLK